MAGLVARVWAEDIVQLQNTSAAHNRTATKNRTAIVKALSSSTKKRKDAWCKRHGVDMSMLAWMTDNGGDLESTYEMYSFGLPKRRYWSTTIARHVLRSEFKKTDEDDSYGLLRELSAEFNRLCGGTEDDVIVELHVVDLKEGQNGKVRGGKGLRIVPVTLPESNIEMNISVIIQPAA